MKFAVTPLLVTALLAAAAFAATPPGAPLTVCLHADATGTVRLRAPESLGIDWPAPGRGSVEVPWMTWRPIDGPVAVEINGRPVMIDPKSADVPAPLAGPADASPSEAAYVPTAAWAPGRDAAVRRWAVGAAVASVLLIASVALLTHGRRGSTPLVLATSVVITAAVAAAPALRRDDTSLRVGIIVERNAAQQQDVWTYQTARVPMRVREPWGGLPRGGTWFVPRSPGHLGRADPVLELDADGKPAAITANVAPGEPAAFLHRGRANADASDAGLDDAAVSPELVRRLYGSIGRLNSKWTLVAATQAAYPKGLSP
jgi:hypothetical protein